MDCCRNIWILVIHRADENRVEIVYIGFPVNVGENVGYHEIDTLFKQIYQIGIAKENGQPDRIPEFASLDSS